MYNYSTYLMSDLIYRFIHSICFWIQKYGEKIGVQDSAPSKQNKPLGLPNSQYLAANRVTRVTWNRPHKDEHPETHIRETFKTKPDMTWFPWNPAWVVNLILMSWRAMT